MAGMFTSKRALTKEAFTKFISKTTFEATPSAKSDTLTSAFPASQSTTSYRSRGDEFAVQVSEGYLTELGKLLNEVNKPAIPTPPVIKRGKEGGDTFTHDTGHPFHTVKRTLWLSHEKYFVRGGRDSWYHGPLWPSHTVGELMYATDPNVQNNPVINTGYYGPKAIQITTPTSPAASSINALAELARDGRPDGVIGNYAKVIDRYAKGGLGTVSGTLSAAAKAAAGDYLNFKFAIEPLISDIQKIARAVIESEKILNQLYRDSGRNIRRSYSFPQLEGSVEIFNKAFQNWALNNMENGSIANQSYFKGYDPANWFNPQLPSGCRGHVRVNLRTFERYKFSGAYTYFFPKGDGSLLDNLRVWARDANKIIGNTVTTETLWNLTPWSWLADWKFNIGDNLANFDNFTADKLVLRYGYLQRYMVSEYTRTAHDVAFYDSIPGTITARYTVRSKERVKATPFGFGSNPNTWSVEQWAILASLGMTRSPRVAW